MDGVGTFPPAIEGRDLCGNVLVKISFSNPSGAKYGPLAVLGLHFLAPGSGKARLNRVIYDEWGLWLIGQVDRRARDVRKTPYSYWVIHCINYSYTRPETVRPFRI